MLKTEERNPKTLHIDSMKTADMVSLLQTEFEISVKAVSDQNAAISAVIDAVTERMKQGGRLLYVGCGTSGRLAVLDAAECPPTFGVPKDTVIGIIAGGESAMRNAIENTEDNKAAGIADTAKYSITKLDSLIGISASGGAAYVAGALEYANSVGALTVAVTSNPDTLITQIAELSIITDTGAEPVTGSTRMKAGTAQKLVLNTISTCVMIKLGYVYENLMINLKPMNIKLRDRMIRIVDSILDCGKPQAEQYLEESEWNIRAAISKSKNTPFNRDN